MMFYTHLVFSLFISLLTYKHFDINPYLFIIICIIAGTLPDIDNPKSKVRIPIISHIINFLLGHRNLLHSLLFGIIISLIIRALFGYYYIPFLFGFMSHLILDAMTKQGINFIYPIKQLTIKGFIKTGGFFEKVLFILFIILNLVVLIL